MRTPGDGPGPGSSTELCPGSRDAVVVIGMDVVDVELSGCVDETMRTLKKRTMSVGPPCTRLCMC